MTLVRMCAWSLLPGDTIIANSGRARRISTVRHDLTGLDVTYADTVTDPDRFDGDYQALVVC